MSTASLELTGYENTTNLLGSASSKFNGVCDIGELFDVRAEFLRAYDGYDTNLKCSSFVWKYLEDDAATDKASFSASFIPYWKVELLLPDQPFRVKISYSSHSYTLDSEAFHWASGAAVLNKSTKPMLTMAVDEITLCGTRDNVNLATYEGYRDKLNSDVFLGMPAGCVLCGGVTASPRQLETGEITYDVEIQLMARAIPWTKYFNETTGLWEVLYGPGGQPIVSFVAMAPLLA